MQWCWLQLGGAALMLQDIGAGVVPVASPRVVVPRTCRRRLSTRGNPAQAVRDKDPNAIAAAVRPTPAPIQLLSLTNAKKATNQPANPVIVAQTVPRFRLSFDAMLFCPPSNGPGRTFVRARS